MNLAAYLRVSTDAQAEHGQGLDVQREAIRAWALAGGHTVTLWTADEGVSGSNGLDARKGLYDSLAALSEGAVGVVVYRLDRLARDLVLQEQLLREVWNLGGRVFSTAASEDAYLSPDGAEDDPSRALIRQILGAVAEYERGMIRLRLRSGKAAKAAKGGYVGGGQRYGMRAEGGSLVPDDDELVVVQLVQRLHGEGKSYRAIGRALAEAGHTPRRAKVWSAETVRVIALRGGPPSEGEDDTATAEGVRVRPAS